MKILAIETSCDETAVAIINAEGTLEQHHFSVLGNALYSQAEKHAVFGGVYPSLAKREHAKNLTPLTERALHDASLLQEKNTKLDTDKKVQLSKLLKREPEMFEQLVFFLEKFEKPDIDVIAVTEGPGLEPALWVGINFARALSDIWDIPLVPINHMEGHIVASLIDEETKLGQVSFPALSLLISGGHTELVLIRNWFEYELIGETRDDAVGEAFDKVARMLDLSYPGGPEVARLAKVARDKDHEIQYVLPRPMLNSNDCDFSFSGLKTAVLYSLRDIGEIKDRTKEQFAREFEDAVVEILTSKTRKAMHESGANTLILGGGVSANEEIRNAFKNMIKNEFPNSLLYLPDRELSTDNAVMIGVAAFLRASSSDHKREIKDLTASGNLKLSK